MAENIKWRIASDSYQLAQNGHVVSLFPGHVSTYPAQSWKVSVKGGHPNVFRLILTYPVLNSARHICFLISGKGEAPMMKTLFELPQGHIPTHFFGEDVQ